MLLTATSIVFLPLIPVLVDVKGRDRDDEPLVVRVVVADRIDHVVPDRAGCAIDRSGVAEEGVQVLNTGSAAPEVLQTCSTLLTTSTVKPFPTHSP